jgi:hypothetical protein
MEKEAGTKSGLKKLGHGIGLALCVFLSLIIIINVTMIVKSYLHPPGALGCFFLYPCCE